MYIPIRRKARLSVFAGSGLLEIYWSGHDMGAILDHCVRAQNDSVPTPSYQLEAYLKLLAAVLMHSCRCAYRNPL